MSSAAILRHSDEKGTLTVNRRVLFESFRQKPDQLKTLINKSTLSHSENLEMIKRSSESFSFNFQLPGEFHGGRSGRLHARQQAPRPASDHSPADVHRPDPHHLPPGQTSEADHASSAGGGGGPGQPHHLSRAFQYAVPRVSQHRFTVLTDPSIHNLRGRNHSHIHT